MQPESELAQLIAEQQQDDRYGHHVLSVSVDDRMAMVVVGQSDVLEEGLPWQTVDPGPSMRAVLRRRRRATPEASIKVSNLKASQRRTTIELERHIVDLRNKGVVVTAIADKLNIADRRVREILKRARAK